MNRKEKFLQDLNEAFARSDIDFLVKQFTDDISWTIVGDRTIQGIDALIDALKEMETNELLEMTIASIITHGRQASVNGTMSMSDASGHKSTFGFCDVYEFSGSKNPKVRQMTSYVVELNGKEKTNG